MDRGARVGCSPAELIAACRSDRPVVSFVWVPEFPRLIPPAEVPWLREAVRERTRQALRYNLKNGFARLAVWVALGVIYHLKYPLPLVAVIVFMLGVVPVLQPAWALWRLRRDPDAFVQEQATILRYQVWLGTRRAVATGLLALCLLCVGLAQVAAARRGVNTIAVAGLVKSKAAQGQPWRLLTCELMHGHPLHFAFNVMALLAIGRLVEMHGHPVYLPSVFLVSALCASTMSFLATPQASVGASGGIMGLIGFLAVLGIRRRQVLPPGFLKSIAVSVALTAATGLVAYHFIDNAAHAGGLAGGVLLGGVYVSRRGGGHGLEPSGLARMAGAISAAALVLATAFTVWLLLAAPAPVSFVP